MIKSVKNEYHEFGYSTKNKVNIYEILKAVEAYLSFSTGSEFKLIASVSPKDNIIRYELFDVESNHVFFTRTFALDEEYCSSEEIQKMFKPFDDICLFIKKLSLFNDTTLSYKYIAKFYLNKSAIRLSDLRIDGIYFEPKDFLEFISMLINIKTFSNTKVIQIFGGLDIKEINGVNYKISYKNNILKSKDYDTLVNALSISSANAIESDKTKTLANTHLNNYLTEEEAVNLLDEIIPMYPFLSILKDAIITRTNISVAEVVRPYVINY